MHIGALEHNTNVGILKGLRRRSTLGTLGLRMLVRIYIYNKEGTPNANYFSPYDEGMEVGVCCSRIT